MKNILFLLPPILISCSHKPNPEVLKAADAISKKTIILPDWVDQDDLYQNLMAVASTEDLISMTNHDDPIVRYCAFIGLRERKYPEIKQIYFDHQDDEMNVLTSNGACLKNWRSVSDLMLWALDPEETRFKSPFTQKEYDSVCQIKICRKVN